ncbi:AMP-binding protein [Corynebacterium auriscanis]|uniref:Acyl-CoA synthetase n=1 Tax=Corynebacterium auriscanis TaxID=99807 RepID=A0A0A2DFZ6_9CORY|nr:AMP-binding protein [Corynebacterium auriscanis]KGM18098.1 acyl-CoA synthetase [Corynebacterium auriscanis]WJY71891.1 Long-chain-fatty-acid--CoA ligase [Corynebacterium auriscanis]
MPGKMQTAGKLQNLKYFGEAAWAEVHAIATGVGTALNSGAVVKGGGLRMKKKLVESITRYGFTAARQAWYAAEVAPNRTAIIDDMGELTYAQVRQKTEAFARALQRMGLGPEKNIAVMARNSRVILYPLIAKGFIGANICLLNPASSPIQLQKTIEELDVHTLIIDEEFAGHLPADYTRAQVIVGHAQDLHQPKAPNPEWKTFQQIIEEAPTEEQEKLPVIPKRGMIVIMSSGTSGTPKAVVNREPLIPTPIADLVTWIPWRAEIMVQQTASMFHSWGWANINLIFAHRATVVLRRVFDPVQAMEDAERYKVNGIITSPIFIKEQLKVAQKGNYDTSSLEFIVSSGNAMHEDLIRGLHQQFGPIVCNFYGSTENSVVAIAKKEELVDRPAMAGRPVRGVRVKILDDEGNVLPRNTPGRIFARGTLSMRRYANERDTMNIQRGLLEIGDRGYLDDEGRLFVLGRADDMIIVGGENVYPRSVEEVLAPMPGIRDLFAMGVDDEETFKRMAVWVVREDSPEGEALTKESIQEWVHTHLAEHSVPREVTFMDELPRNPTGKVMPRMLPNV